MRSFEQAQFNRLKAMVLDTNDQNTVLQVEYPLESRKFTVPSHRIQPKFRKRGLNLWLVRNGRNVSVEPMVQ